MATKYYKVHFCTILFLDVYVSLDIPRKISPNFKQFSAQEILAEKNN